MLTRRRMLTMAGAAGAAGAAWPLLRPLSAYAGDSDIPTRLVVITTPNGVLRDEWFPTTGGETDFVLGPVLEPLTRHRERLILFGSTVDGFREERGISIQVKAEGDGPSGGHGWGKILTGTLPDTSTGTPIPISETVDYFIGRRVQGEAPFDSLQLGIRVGAGSVGGDCRDATYGEGGVPIPAENDPETAFNRIFAAVATPDPAIEQAKRRRRSVLDFASGEITALRPRLGAADRRMLDQHTSAIRDLERTLDASVMCTPPTGIGPVEVNGWDTYTNVEDIAAMQLEIATSALGCDLARVVTMQYGRAGANNRHEFIGGRANEWYHSLSHDGADEAARDAKRAIQRWHSEQVALLMDRLAATPERDGSTVLDHTLFLWVNEMSDGVYHTHQDMPFLLAAGSQVGLRTGRYVRYANKSHNDLLVSVCHAMGLDDVTSFGDPAFSTGPLPDLT
ncbi:MAG: DUF1552 domain-containing protein [Sandaracinaceae bacterium]